MEPGDTFDRGDGSYEEYLGPRGDDRDRTLIYGRQQSPPYDEIKVFSSTERGFLPKNYRKIGPKEKNRLLVVYARAIILNPEDGAPDS